MFKTIRYLFCLLLFLLPWLVTQIYYSRLVIPFNAVLPAPVAIVFGAGLTSQNTPSAILAKRISVGVKLYQLKKVKKLLLSGDGSTPSHNEPIAMRNLALKLGVSPQDLILDYNGSDTYNTCANAKEVFEIDKAILVTQPYHLPRALFVCNNLQITSVGVGFESLLPKTWQQAYRYLREIPATLAAWVEVWGHR